MRPHWGRKHSVQTEFFKIIISVIKYFAEYGFQISTVFLNVHLLEENFREILYGIFYQKVLIFNFWHAKIFRTNRLTINRIRVY